MTKCVITGGFHLNPVEHIQHTIAVGLLDLRSENDTHLTEAFLVVSVISHILKLVLNLIHVKVEVTINY